MNVCSSRSALMPPKGRKKANESAKTLTVSKTTRKRKTATVEKAEESPKKSKQEVLLSYIHV